MKIFISEPLENDGKYSHNGNYLVEHDGRMFLACCGTGATGAAISTTEWFGVSLHGHLHTKPNTVYVDGSDYLHEYGMICSIYGAQLFDKLYPLLNNGSIEVHHHISIMAVEFLKIHNTHKIKDWEADKEKFDKMYNKEFIAWDDLVNYWGTIKVNELKDAQKA